MPTDKIYFPEKFASLYEEGTLGRRLWDLVNEPEMIIRMETATALGRPACEPLADILLERFPELTTTKEAVKRGKAFKSRHDRIKQMIGHMIRQVMEKQGYQYDQPSVRITSRDFFRSGSRYIKKG
ncbi:MAG: hypothetical protein M5R36_08550 [Deltaproteobacteria bacterium]|nr:hypothetical protein [Deltaproteobacteria bacterium]